MINWKNIHRGSGGDGLRLDRLVSILVLLHRRERVQAKEMAEMFNVSVRTILRDVETLNLAGIPITTYQGANGGIGIIEGYRLNTNVLSRDEMSSIITTLKGVARVMPSTNQEILIEKIKNTLSSSQLEILNSKANQLVIDLSPWGGDELFKEYLANIRKAIEDFKEIEFDYVDSVGKSTSRRIEPYSLVLKGQKWYLYGWCCIRQDFRLFKLYRMRELNVTETVFKPREISLEELPWEGDWQNSGSMISLELVFEKEMESIVSEWFRDTIEKHEDGRIMVRVVLPENNWLYGFILSFGAGVEVVNPPHIRKIISEIADKIHKKYL